MTGSGRCSEASPEWLRRVSKPHRRAYGLEVSNGEEVYDSTPLRFGLAVPISCLMAERPTTDS